jgi:hypothetical protein
MKTFVIFGDIEFLEDDAHFGDIEFLEDYARIALVHNVQHSGFYGNDELGEVADKYGGDYLVPHYFDGDIIFIKYHKETV